MTHTTHQPSTRRVYSPGKFQPAVDGEQIRQQAYAAAAAGKDLSAACPYPFWSEAGQHFKTAYYKARWAGAAVDAMKDGAA